MRFVRRRAGTLPRSSASEPPHRQLERFRNTQPARPRGAAHTRHCAPAPFGKCLGVPIPIAWPTLPALQNRRRCRGIRKDATTPVRAAPRNSSGRRGGITTSLSSRKPSSVPPASKQRSPVRGRSPAIGIFARRLETWIPITVPPRGDRPLPRSRRDTWRWCATTRTRSRVAKARPQPRRPASDRSSRL